MSEKQKYVRLKEFNEVIIFPCVLEHSAFKHWYPVSAGFCYINTEKGTVECFDRSVSLNLESDPQDSFYATKQMFGWDRASELLKTKSKENQNNG